MHALVLKAIEKLIEDRYTCDGRTIQYYYDEELEESISLDEAIHNLMIELSEQGEIYKFTIDTLDVEDSPGYATGVIAVAWEIEGDLGSTIIQWEAF